MKNLNPIKKKLSKEDRKISVQEPSKLLAEFFNGVVIELNEEYAYVKWKILSHALTSITTNN